jgi:hypothetical protein
MTTRRLPIVLEDVRVASPCKADWDEMSGDERVRFCGQCEKNVYNLSAMTRADAEALVREKEGRLCIRFFKRPDGTMLTADCPVGVERKRLRQRIKATIAGWASAAAVLVGLVTGRARADLSLKDGKTPQPPQPNVTVTVQGGAVARPEWKGQAVVVEPPKPTDVKPTTQVKKPSAPKAKERKMNDYVGEMG